MSTPPHAPAERRGRADHARLVADMLRHQIHGGAFDGSALPSEAQLVRDYRVSRGAVRDALRLLRDEGLVGRTPRVGTRVAQRKYAHGIDTLLGLNETLREHGAVRNEVRAAVESAPPPVVARRLGLADSEPVVCIERLRFLGDLPLSLDTTYLAPDIGREILAQDLRAHDIFTLIEELRGKPLGDADLAIEAVGADAHSAALLQVPAGSALLLLERLTHLPDGRPVDLEYIRMRGDRITLRGSLTRRRTPELANPEQANPEPRS